MNWLKNLIGLALISVSWLDVLGSNFQLKLTLLIIGFDLTSLLFKILIFLINSFLLFHGKGIFLSWVFFTIIVLEFLFSQLKSAKFLKLVSKPSIIFFSVLFSLQNIHLALILAGIDLIINLKN
ncbi:MAG: hypothetical protein QW472_03130 [Candidatus Aenigmatarchaeota archaeon]